jgi:hypothetical protein
MSRLLGVFAGLALLASHWSFHDHDGRAILVGCWGCGTPSLESPPLVLLTGVLSVWHCPLVHITPIFPVPVLTLKGGVWVTSVVPCHL